MEVLATPTKSALGSAKVENQAKKNVSEIASLSFTIKTIDILVECLSLQDNAIQNNKSRNPFCLFVSA